MAQNLQKTRYFGLFMANFHLNSLRKTLSLQNTGKLCSQKDPQIFSALYGVFRFAPIWHIFSKLCANILGAKLTIPKIADRLVFVIIFFQPHSLKTRLKTHMTLWICGYGTYFRKYVPMLGANLIIP